MITLDSIKAENAAIEIQTAAGQALAIDGSGFITISNSSFAVTATDLDIRDLDSAQDNIEIQTAAGQALTIDASGFITSNINGTVTVTATDLDIRDLTHVSDSVKVGDGTDFLAINTDGSINTTSVQGGFATWKVTNETVTNSESELVSTPLVGRVKLLIQNLGNQDMYIKDITGVSTSNGILLPKGSSFEEQLDDAANIFAITGSGSSDVRLAEYAA